MIYLDNAATSFPKPNSVIEKMLNVQKYFAANAGRSGHKMSIKSSELIFQTRENLAKMFNCEIEKVIFTQNCTHAINTAIFGSVKKSSHVIISSLEHNSVFRPVHKLAQKGFISYDVAKVEPLDDEQTLKNFENLIKKNTTHIICTHSSNVFGTLLPIEKIANLCKQYKLKFILDAAQSAGNIKIDMKSIGIDVLCVPGHKGLLGTMGTGALLIGENVDVEPIMFGGTGSQSLEVQQPDFYPDKLESGTLNLIGIAALNEGINFIKNYGGEKAVHEKEKYLSNLLKQDLSVIPNLISYNDMHGKDYCPVVSFNMKGLHSEQTAQYLFENNFAVRAGYQCSSLAHRNYNTLDTGVVRASIGIFNTKKDVKNLIFYINRFAILKKV